jgi:FkbM family methyltransferase
MALTLLDRAEEEGRKFYNVTMETRTLDTFIDRPVGFLKLDIEGAECEVITSLKTQLSLVRSGISSNTFMAVPKIR